MKPKTRFMYPRIVNGVLSNLLSGSRLIFFLLLTSGLLNAQELVTEIDLNGSRLEKISVMPTRDSIFLSIQSKSSTVGSAKEYIWISNAGRHRKIAFHELDYKILCGITSYEDTTNYYYFEESKTGVFIKALRFSERDQNKLLPVDAIELRGKLLGSFVDGDLFLICAAQKDFTIRLVQIHNLKIVNESVFKMSNDIVGDKRKKISFLAEGLSLRPEQALASIKIMNAVSQIVITIDEPFYEFKKEPQGLFKTTVIRLDKATRTSDIRIFFEESEGFFSSSVLGNCLYRVVYAKGLKIETYNLDNGKRLGTTFISGETKHSTTKMYSRNGKSKMVSTHFDVRAIVNGFSNNFIIADSSANDIVLVVGIGGEYQPPVPFVSVFGLLPAMLGALASVVIKDITESPLICSYFYLRGLPEKGFRIADDVPSAMRKVDEYELTLQASGRKPEFKGYLAIPEGILVFHQEKKSDRVKILKFTD